MRTDGNERGAGSSLRGDRVVRAALDQVNDGGLESLTMRRLTERLGTHLPTLYRIFADKNAIVDEMAEAILARAMASADTDAPDWTTRAKAIASSLRGALLAQRDGARIVGGNYAAKRNNLLFFNSLVGCMKDSGLPGEWDLWATSSIFCFVLGETLEQQGADGSESAVLAGIVRDGQYRHLATDTVGPLFDFDARFDFGLDLLLRGVQQRVAADGSP